MRILALILFSAACVFSQTPPIEPGVSQELAKWRAAHYSDVRYKLNLTLEKMSPVLKGTMEIRVKVSGGEGGNRSEGAATQSSPPYEGGVDAALGGRGGSLIILDWRKIKGYEDRSTITDVSINGRTATLENHPVGETPTPLLRKEGSPDDRPLTFIERNEHLIFHDGVAIGENVIKLDFTSPILTSGSAITRYVDKEDGAEYIYSLFVPSDASTAFPVFDQPDLKARFTLSMAAPATWSIISNSASADTKTKYLETLLTYIENKDTNPTWTFTFRETEPISTYVFAFAAGNFDEISEVSREIAIKNLKDEGKTFVIDGEVVANEIFLPKATGAKIYVRKSQAEKFKPHAAEVFRLNREAIKYFEEYFDYEFPFPKYDLVLIPEFPFGGMEHAGATFLRESAIIFPQEPTKNDHISRAVLMFHEAAHQWFGDTVTMRWFDDLWLKEGFANFAAYKAMERIMPEANAWKVFYERIKQGAYQTDSTKGTTPIYQEIKNLSAAKSAYGNIVYNKAPAFLRQAEFYLGEDKFQTAVRAFLKKHEFKNAGWEDLVKEFEAASKLDLKPWANAWVKQPGLPVVRVTETSGIAGGEKTYGIYQQPYLDKGADIRWIMRTKVLIFESFYHNSGARISRRVNEGIPDSPIYVELRGLDQGFEAQAFFPNYQDYGYGIFLLDDKSRDYVQKNIQNEKDPFLRAMMWGSLWDSVREGELAPQEYVRLVMTILGSPAYRRPPQDDESTIALLLNRVGTAMTYYMPLPPTETERPPRSVTGDDKIPTFVGSNEISGGVENMLMGEMQRSEQLGRRLTFYRAFLNLASSEGARAYLKQILAGDTAGRIDEIPLKTKDKFDIVTRLLILKDPDASKLLANLEKAEKGDDAKRYAYAARAGIATAENKAKYWNDFVNNKEISESWIEVAFGPFNSIRHNDLTLPYLQKALQELPNHKRSRKIFFVNGWLGAFIGGQRSEEALAIVNKFLADNPNLDKDLRLKILENVDVIERAVKIREKYGKN